MPAHAEEEMPLPHFARAATPADASLNALAVGELRIDENNCLRHGDSVVIWHHDTTVERTDDGRIRLIDGFNGKAVYVGETIAMSGGHGTDILNWDGIGVAEPAPPDECTGSFWSGGPVNTAEETQEMLKAWEARTPVPSPPG
ncbi:hypothetical protein [Devosia nitrariae]|uniref:hypothetical protein n=1 Tax=Devosia nitrariae TaxID=2071872 RepID=UPI0036D411FE